MKIAFAIALSITCFCVAFCQFWYIPHGTTFHRAKQDLDQFHNSGIPSKMVYDPWGNTYIPVTASYGQTSVRYLISYGPDGKSETLGHDPDDINIWTRADVWLESQYPLRFCKYLISTFAGISATLLFLLLAKNSIFPERKIT